MVAYTHEWEKLADALKRVRAATGESEEQAKIDLCNAIAGRKINVRVRVVASGSCFSGGNVGVPPYLAPDDLDWQHSSPLPPKRWQIGPAGHLHKDATRHHFDIVMAWSVDRLGRSLQGLVAFLQEIHGAGIDLFLFQQAIDTTTPAGKAMYQMCGVFAEFERAMIVERVRS